MEKIKFKNENVYIFVKVNKEKKKQLIKARTFTYRNHKFNLQGDYNTGYSISDNATGVIIGIPIFNLKDIHSEKVQNKLDYFIDNTIHSKIYEELVTEYEECTNYMK